MIQGTPQQQAFLNSVPAAQSPFLEPYVALIGSSSSLATTGANPAFLAPTFGTSGQSGFEFALPYYWNIAENMDATVTPKTLSKRGLQLGGEFRYLEPTFKGTLERAHLHPARLARRDRRLLLRERVDQAIERPRERRADLPPRGHSSVWRKANCSGARVVTGSQDRLRAHL